MAAGNGALPTLGALIGSAETALAKLYELRAKADAEQESELSQRLGETITSLSTSVMRLKIERVGIVEAELQLLTAAMNGVNQNAAAGLQSVEAVEKTLSSVASFLKIADMVISRVTSF